MLLASSYRSHPLSSPGTKTCPWKSNTRCKCKYISYGKLSSAGLNRKQINFVKTVKQYKTPTLPPYKYFKIYFFFWIRRTFKIHEGIKRIERDQYKTSTTWVKTHWQFGKLEFLFLEKEGFECICLIFWPNKKTANTSEQIHLS